MTYSVKDVQLRFGVSQATVLHWVSSGQLKALNVGRDPGKLKARYRITDAALAEFEAARTTASPDVSRRRRRPMKSANQVIEFIK